MLFFACAVLVSTVILLIAMPALILAQYLNRWKRDLLNKILDILFWAWIILAVAFFVISIYYRSASAAENSALPAPAESAITVKGYTSCPTEFDLADPGWVLHRIYKPELKKFGEGIAVLEHSTLLSYFPDPEQQADAEMNRWGNRDCVAQLFAYGSGIERQNVWAAIRASGQLTVFLSTGNGWERGGENMPETVAICDAADSCVLIFVLQRDGKSVASLVLPVEQIKFPFFHREPVE